MKRTLLFLAYAALLLFTQHVAAQAIFSEDFNYSEGTRLAGTNGWTVLYTGTEMTVGSEGLTYSGYPGSGIGKAISIIGGSGSEAPYHTAAMPTSGSIYLSFLVNVSGTDAEEGYFAILGNFNAGNYRAVVYTKIVSGSVYFGAAPTAGGTPVYDATAYAAGTTYLVVLKYTLIGGNNNDEIRLFISSSGVASSEPATPNVGPVMMSGEEFFDVSTVALSSGYFSANSRLLGATLLVDGIRVGSSWAQTVLPAPVFSATPSNLNFGTIAASTTKVDSFKIKNSGTAGMNISSVVSDNASFITSQEDTAIAVGDSAYYCVTFAPTTAGWKSGTLKFYHDGAGSPSSLSFSGNVFAEEPSSQASDLVFSSVNSSSMTLSWTNGDGSNRIVIIKTGSAVDAFPDDEQSYSSDSRYGSGSEIGSGNFVVYAGTGSTCEVTVLLPTTDYYFAVMEYNGSGGAENYLVTSPLTGTQTTTVGTTWSGSNGTVTFAKLNYADWMQSGNQDRITDNVWITRQNNSGFFNIKSESNYDNSISPDGTEWAFGTTDEVGLLTFDTWYNTNGQNRPSIGQDMVVHLIADDIYLDINFLSWTSNDQGGGFSYTRAASGLEVFSLSATNVTNTSATLNGSVFSLNTTASAYALYSTTSGVYNDSVLLTPNTISAGSQISVSADISGLSEGAVYYFCIAAYNGECYKQSGEKSFIARTPVTWSSSNGTITFTKADFANWTQSGNQDRITDNVWITRKNSQGIFNIQSEGSFDGSSPAGTEWAYGTTADISSLTFDTWGNTNGWYPPSIVGQDMVLHLITDDIYLDIKFLSWSQGDGSGGTSGGGFSYVRAAGLFEVSVANAANITSTSATLSGQVYCKDSTVTSYILIGTVSGLYTDSVQAAPAVIGANSVTAVGADFSGLTEGVRYYYCIAAMNATMYKRSGENSFIPREFVIWSSSNGTITFTKTDYADWTKAANQDCITDNVWITRANSQGIFNIQSESSSDGNGGSAPAGTEWAYGTTADIGSLTFGTWYNTISLSGWPYPDYFVGEDMVVHLIADDIYIDIKFLSWTSGGNGGGFSYIRAAGPLEVLATNASGITSSTAALNSSIFSLESEATAYALYGTSCRIYTDSVLVTPDPIDAGSLTSVTANVSELDPGTIYYFCIAVNNNTLYKRSGEVKFMTYSSSPGNALKFDGNDDYVEIPYTGELNPSIFTYEFWARVDGGSGTYRCPLSTRFWDWGSSYYGVNFYAREDNVWDFAWGGGADAGHWYGLTGSAVEEGEWTHLAATNDGTTMRFYINGILQGDTTLAYAPAPYTFIPLRFGSIADGSSAFFNGAIDEVRVWNVARTEEEIQNTMNTSFTESQAGLVGYWQMNEATGTAVHDLAGCNNAMLNNFNFDATDGWISNDIALPVELTSFSVASKHNSVELKWTTATEVENYGFEVEKKLVSSFTVQASGQNTSNLKPETLNKQWQRVGFVEGSGNYNAPKEYSFTEKKVADGNYEYRLKLVDLAGSFKYSQSIEAEVKFIPAVFALSQNYPNPFNPSTIINYQLPAASHVDLRVYDMLGKEVATLVNGMQEAGNYDLKFEARNLASGVYFYRIHASGFVSIKKMLLLR